MKEEAHRFFSCRLIWVLSLPFTRQLGGEGAESGMQR
jgi:hypothetical protein